MKMRRTSGSKRRQTWRAVAHTLQATSDPEEDEATEEERHEQGEERQRKGGQRIEEKEEILRLLKEWRSEPSSLTRWADCVEGKFGKREELEDETEKKRSSSRTTAKMQVLKNSDEKRNKPEVKVERSMRQVRRAKEE